MLRQPINKYTHSNELKKEVWRGKSSTQNISVVVQSLMNFFPETIDSLHTGGYRLRRPLELIPENRLTYVVGDINYYQDGGYIIINNRISQPQIEYLKDYEKVLFEVLLNNRNRILNWEEIKIIAAEHGVEIELWNKHFSSLSQKVNKNSQILILGSKGEVLFRDKENDAQELRYDVNGAKYYPDMRVFQTEEAEIILPRIPGDLLEFFIKNRGKQLTTKQILEGVWGITDAASRNINLPSNIDRLQQLIWEVDKNINLHIQGGYVGRNYYYTFY